jgi:hypothetical protein
MPAALRALILLGASPLPSEMDLKCTLHDGAGVTHTPARRSRNTGDKAHDWLFVLVVLLNPVGSLLLNTASDFADHDDASVGQSSTLCFRVLHEALQHIDEVGAVEGVSSYADDGGLAEPCLGGLVDGLVGEGA